MGRINKTRKNTREKRKVLNWGPYNKSLKNRGNITIWLDDEVKDNWYYGGSRKPGGKIEYSDTAIEFILTIKYLFKMGYRQVEGFIEGFFNLAQISDLKVPSYTQIQRRASGIKVNIRVRKESKENLVVVVDSSGLKVYGEGEWKVRKHGWSKHRKWRKIHVASDGEDLEILGVEVTGNEVDDSTAGVEVINQIEESIEKIAADGAYDKKKFRNGLPEEIKQIIPPQKNAVLTEDKKMKQRNEAIKEINKIGREKWKEKNGYHIRSKSEVNMYRYKKIFGAEMSSRKTENEITETKIKCKTLNKFLLLGMPISIKVA